MPSYNPVGGGHSLADPAGQVPINVTIINSSTQILPANDNRRFCILSNIGVKDVYVAVGQTALNEKGITLFKGGTLVIGREGESVKEIINGITSTGSSLITIQEVL